MSGVYIHIPFCKQRCHYCDFYSSTQISKKKELVKSICLELKQRKHWLKNTTVNTIYFGGGTPSLLSEKEICAIINSVFENYKVANKIEVTLEANPDDLSKNKIKELVKTPINRISIGIQSFDDKHLQLMNRRHSGEQAINAIKQCQDAGFNNISGDLIYGLPNLTMQEWECNLNAFSSLCISHLSAYHLTFEPNTVFGVLQKKGRLMAIDEQESIEQFDMLTQWAKQEKLIHYEISNFAKKGYLSKHNSSYWFQKKYLGVGPSAHSYNKDSRTWNFANIDKYIKYVNSKKQAFDYEYLNINDKQNEYLITRLRTVNGINLKQFEKQFGKQKTESLISEVQKFVKKKQVECKNNILTLTHKGILLSDSILADIIIV